MVSQLAYTKALESMENLHANMAVLAQLYCMLQDTNASLDQVSRLLETDGVLAANVIRISNSAFYGSSERSKDVRSAIQKVGLNEVLHLVGAAISKQVFMKDLKAYGITADDYWMHSYLCATLMESLGKTLGLDSDEAYLCGLLHAIGRVVINEMLAEQKMEIYWDANIAPEVWEEAVVGLRYHEVGADLLRRWKFSESVITAVRNQLDEVVIQTDLLPSLMNFITQWALTNHYALDTDWVLPEAHVFMDLSQLDEETCGFALEDARRLVRSVKESL